MSWSPLSLLDLPCHTVQLSLLLSVSLLARSHTSALAIPQTRRYYLVQTVNSTFTSSSLARTAKERIRETGKPPDAVLASVRPGGDRLDPPRFVRHLDILRLRNAPQRRKTNRRRRRCRGCRGRRGERGEMGRQAVCRRGLRLDRREEVVAAMWEGGGRGRAGRAGRRRRRGGSRRVSGAERREGGDGGGRSGGGRGGRRKV